jgi:nitric oxide reductase NorE protein
VSRKHRVCAAIWGWLVILLELLTLPSLFVSYALPARARSRFVQRFAGHVNLHTGALNTVLLIRQRLRGGASVQLCACAQCLRALVAAARLRERFQGIKLWEADKMAEGVDLSTNTFYMFYLLLTGFHFLHVLVGLLALGWLWLRTRRGAYDSTDCHALETGAAFWHMVDLLWIVLFPLVYVMR